VPIPMNPGGPPPGMKAVPEAQGPQLSHEEMCFNVCALLLERVSLTDPETETEVVALRNVAAKYAREHLEKALAKNSEFDEAWKKAAKA
jgi:hypothetical protein